jgi:hypothetical protein
MGALGRPFRARALLGILIPRALPWAFIGRPFGAEAAKSVLLRETSVGSRFLWDESSSMAVGGGSDQILVQFR